jgi:hypothetical protein
VAQSDNFISSDFLWLDPGADAFDAPAGTVEAGGAGDDAGVEPGVKAGVEAGVA